MDIHLLSLQRRLFLPSRCPNEMPESELVIALPHEEDEQARDMESSTSPNLSKTKRTRLTFPFGACRVCSDSATGIHYGIATCEGCKGFFKRSILRKEKYRCYFDSTCLINVTNRNRCKACRFRRCIDEGMSVDGVKMGRIPKLVKERALKELKEQQMKEEAALAGAGEVHARESSCSSISDRSVENYDPNGMETDFTELQLSPVQRQNDLSLPYANINYGKKLSAHSPIPMDRTSATNESYHTVGQSNSAQCTKAVTVAIQPTSNTHEQGKNQLIYRTKYPTFLPDDFTADETEGVTMESTGLLMDDAFRNMKSIANKLRGAQTSLAVELNEQETTMIRYLRWSTCNIFLRRSKRAKQMVSRMNKMIENNVRQFPGDGRTLEEFFISIRLSCQVYTRAMVVYVQELPGMKNINLKNLEKLILHRSFEWFILKYHELYNDDGQCYFLGPDGFQFTRYWMDELHGGQLSDSIFDFCRRLRELRLTESEFALVLPLHTCHHDSNIDDDEVRPMLRSCYLYALYTELCHNRGEVEGKRICSKTLQVLELLTPLAELYDEKAAGRILEA